MCVQGRDITEARGRDRPHHLCVHRVETQLKLVTWQEQLKEHSDHFCDIHTSTKESGRSASRQVLMPGEHAWNPVGWTHFRLWNIPEWRKTPTSGKDHQSGIFRSIKWRLLEWSWRKQVEAHYPAKVHSIDDGIGKGLASLLYVSVDQVMVELHHWLLLDVRYLLVGPTGCGKTSAGRPLSTRRTHRVRKDFCWTSAISS